METFSGGIGKKEEQTNEKFNALEFSSCWDNCIVLDHLLPGVSFLATLPHVGLEISLFWSKNISCFSPFRAVDHVCTRVRNL
jgi:hypothetical protein